MYNQSYSDGNVRLTLKVFALSKKSGPGWKIVFIVLYECGCRCITSFLFVFWVAFWGQVDFWLLLGCGMFSFCCNTMLNSREFWGLALSMGFV